jgi:D-alanyl-D-alanine dipeptidase
MTIIQIADPEVLAIPIKECHEPLVDLRSQEILAFGPPPECEATKECYTKLRKTVYEKLCAAQAKLPSGWKFRIYEGYRSLAVQQLLFDWVSEKIDRDHPELSPSERFKKITELVSPLKDLKGNKNIPVHNTGAAVDLEIIDAHGNLIDMGMAVKDWITVEPSRCYFHAEQISSVAVMNRNMLKQVMNEQGFVGYPFEWWHFSYGDRYWALMTGKKVAIYGSADDLT